MGFAIGLLIGIICGFLLCSHLMRWLFVSGRMTSNWIAEACDRLIAADDEPTEAPAKRTTL